MISGKRNGQEFADKFVIDLLEALYACVFFFSQNWHLSLDVCSKGGITRPTVADSHDMDNVGEDHLQAALDRGKLW